jgi:guanylate kinase
MTADPSLHRRAGLPLIVCAPSGTGKTTLLNRLKAEFPLHFSVSCTTRPPRPGEEHGREYFFLSRDEFREKWRQGLFAEWAEVHGHFYGTPLLPLRERLENGEDMLFDIDVQGAAQLLLAVPGARSVFILPPSLEVLADRLRKRNTETEESLALRLANARQEISSSCWFEAWIINDDLDRAYADLRAFYRACTLGTSLRPGLTRLILEEG